MAAPSRCRPPPGRSSFEPCRIGHARRVLGQCAATLVSAGQIVLIDAGSTNFHIARSLPEGLAVTVVTNAPAVAAELVGRAGCELIVIGGRIEPRVGGSIGARAIRDLQGLRANLCFLGTCAADPVAGITAFDAEEAEFKRIMIERSERIIVALTNDKLSTAAPFGVAAPAGHPRHRGRRGRAGRPARRFRGERAAAAPRSTEPPVTQVLAAVRNASWAERGAAFVVFFVIGLAVGAWAAALPAIKAKLDLSDTQLSLALFSLSIGSVLSTVLTGLFASRLGTGRITSIGCVVLTVALLLPPLAESLAQFAAVGFLIGASIGSVDVAVNGHASHIEQRWGGPIMSSFHGAFSLGGLSGSALGGLIAWAGWGVVAQLWVPVVIAAACTLGALPYLGKGPDKPVAGSGLVWPERAMLGLCAIVLFCFVIEGALADWSAVYLSQVAGSSIAAAASGYAGFSVAMAAVRLAGDRVVERFGPRLVVCGGGALAALGLGLAVAVPQPVPAAFGFALVGIGAANIIPVVFSTAARIGSSPTAGVAVVSSVGYAGFLSGPPLIGTVASFAGLRAGIFCMVVAAVLMTLAAVVSLRRSR